MPPHPLDNTSTAAAAGKILPQQRNLTFLRVSIRIKSVLFNNKNEKS